MTMSFEKGTAENCSLSCSLGTVTKESSSNVNGVQDLVCDNSTF